MIDSSFTPNSYWNFYASHRFDQACKDPHLRIYNIASVDHVTDATFVLMHYSS